MKYKYTIATTIILAALVSGCATHNSPEAMAKKAELQKTIPVCSGEADCKAKWEAAQLWVVHNAAYKIQIMSDVLIETYNATNSEPSIAARVTKEPLGGGKYRLLVSVWCDNVFGCVPDSMDAALDFNKTVSAARP